MADDDRRLLPPPPPPRRRVLSLKTTPSCRGCGTTVEKKGDVCAACAEKPQFQRPQPAVELLSTGPEPVYHRQGGFRRLESDPDQG